MAEFSQPCFAHVLSEDGEVQCVNLKDCQRLLHDVPLERFISKDLKCLLKVWSEWPDLFNKLSSQEAGGETWWYLLAE